MKHKKVLGSTGLLLFYLGVFLVFIAPIVRLLFMSLKGSDGYGLSNYQVLLQEKRTREAIFNTILIAASSTMIAIVAGSSLYQYKKKKAFRITGAASFHYPLLYYYSFLERIFK